MDAWDFLRVSVVSPPVSVADPIRNSEAIVRFASQCESSDVVLFPELCLTGYTCGDLFAQEQLLDRCLEQLPIIANANRDRHQLWVIGLPLLIENQLFNCAAAIFNGQVIGIVPKTFLPTYQEFYEARWFQSSTSLHQRSYRFDGYDVPLGTDLLFKINDAIIGIEICEDLWMPIPPSSLHSLAGANVILNLSASNETIGKADWRMQLVSSQAGRTVTAYAYASAGPSESTTDLVFGGHCMIAELGTILAQSPRVGTDWAATKAGTVTTADIDLHRIMHDRQVMQTALQGTNTHVPVPYRQIECWLSMTTRPLLRKYSGQPFVPQVEIELSNRCREVSQIQRAALAKRLGQLPSQLPLAIGVSGGLDSTLALLVAVETCDDCEMERKRILGLTMPGFGTGKQSRSNALSLMEQLGVTSITIDIRETCLQVFRSMNYSPFGIDVSKLDVNEFQKQLEALDVGNRSDLTFENVQARTRTLLLMSHGFVLGTGDMSESALGWSTYNGDHMSMYNVNCGVPKTLVKFLIEHLAQHDFDAPIREILMDIAKAPISPELLPLTAEGHVHQATEETIGPYELHDFFLYHLVRTGASVERLRFLAAHADFSRDYSQAIIDQTLATFMRRFFTNQFKRSCVPDGPKVGSVSLSPRGDWRMPSDASVDGFL